jgi:hypothetical protein
MKKGSDKALVKLQRYILQIIVDRSYFDTREVAGKQKKIFRYRKESVNIMFKAKTDKSAKAIASKRYTKFCNENRSEDVVLTRMFKEVPTDTDEIQYIHK